MNPGDFKKPLGKLLHIGQGEAAYSTFMPNSLNPFLTFCSLGLYYGQYTRQASILLWDMLKCGGFFIG